MSNEPWSNRITSTSRRTAGSRQCYILYKHQKQNRIKMKHLLCKLKIETFITILIILGYILAHLIFFMPYCLFTPNNSRCNSIKVPVAMSSWQNQYNIIHDRGTSKDIECKFKSCQGLFLHPNPYHSINGYRI